MAAASMLGCATTGLEWPAADDDSAHDEDFDRASDERGRGPRRDGGFDTPDPDATRPPMRDGGRDARVLLDARLDNDAGDAGRGGLRCPLGSPLPVQAGQLLPREGFDYISVREAVEPFGGAVGGDAWTSTSFRTLSEAGMRCARAVGEACEEKIGFHPATLANPLCVGRRCSEYAVVTSRGDEVRRWATPEELALLFGPIDSQDEALMLAVAEGYLLSCEDPAHSAVRALDDGYEVVATRQLSACPARAELVHLFVSRTGEVEVRTSSPLPPSSEPCVVTP